MSECSEAEMKARKAWRDLLIPAVGSAAFFASMVVNVLKTNSKYGWPKKAFKPTDYVLMSIPFVILALAIGEEVNGDLDDF